MEHHIPRGHATSNVLAWTTTSSANVEPSVEEDAGADTDEPPDCRRQPSTISTHFHRVSIRRGSEHHESLLTKALQSHLDEDGNSESEYLHQRPRQRSITSNTSVASTAELTCGTGITTPARTSSPSPRLRNISFAPLAAPAPKDIQRDLDEAVRALQKKRCISFACAARPKPAEKASITPPHRTDNGERGEQTPPRKTTIKFVCPPRPPRAADLPLVNTRQRSPMPRAAPSTPKASAQLEQQRSPSTARALRSPSFRKTAGGPVAARNKKWLSADSSDLDSEAARFHEFASDELQEEDWIRRGYSVQPKLTIDDTLKKELAIRKLGEEAEEEAELEEQLDEEDEEEDEEVDEADLIDDDDDDDDDDEDDDGESSDHENDDPDGEEDDEDEDGSDDADTQHAWKSEASDGYKTDNETGFAESDDEDDDLVLWTTRIGDYPLSGAMMMARRPSHGENSDSTASSNRKARRNKRSRTRPVAFRSETPELPDSTDFVCGTLDEDKPLEEAYISCVEARKRDRRQVIPQDIDPSFPTSEPEDEGDEPYNRGYGDSEDHVWLHGELEDLHHDRDRKMRRKNGAHLSPMRCRSPPPKGRGRSPRKLSDQRSPRLRSPAPFRKSPLVSPMPDGEGIAFQPLAVRRGLMQTKSLPRTPDLFPHLKTRKPKAGSGMGQTHVRGAIDIVMGLEQKRQRRKEKYFQKYFNRARKEKAQTKRPPPGQGAERMRELGLIMAGKVGHGNYVISI